MRPFDPSLRLLSALLMIAAIALGASPRLLAEDIPAGEKAFVELRCSLCHSVETAGIEAKTKSDKIAGGDLSRIACEVEPAWLPAFISGKETKDGEKHKKEFKGTDEELQALVAWLQEQAEAAKAADAAKE